MQKHNTKEEYLETIGKQIRWKRAKKPLVYELESHILDRQSSFIENGMEETEAETRAVAEMGDAEAVGIELDRVHRPRPNWLLIGGVVSLFAFGVLLLWAVGGASEQFTNMLICGGIGVVFLILGYLCDYTALPKFSVPVLIALCFICAFASITGCLPQSSCIQLCYAFPFAFMGLIFSLKNTYKPYILSGAAFICVALPIITASPLPTVTYNAVILSIILFYSASTGLVSENKFKSLLPALTVVSFYILLIVACLHADNGRIRWTLQGIFNPESDPYASGWVPLRVRELIDTSVFIGVGESNEFIEYFTRSSDFTNVDFMLATGAHKYGLILFVAVAVLLAVMFFVIIYGVKKQSCRLGKLTLITVGSAFALRIAAYFMCNLGYPIISLNGIPLFSYNGKLIILDMFMTGVMLSVFRMESIARDSNIQPRFIHS